jgi:succinoglycan biosynthesis transport protein ExoP
MSPPKSFPPSQGLQIQNDGPFPALGGDYQPSVVSEYVRVLLRHRWLIGICGLTGLIAALLISLSMRAEYEATARIAVELDDSNPLAVEQRAPEGTQISTKLETQLRILQSDSVGKNVIDALKLTANCNVSRQTCGSPILPFIKLTPKVRADLLSNYRRGFHAELVPRTQILEVKFRSPDPRLAAEIANAISNVDIYENFRERLDGVQRASTWLNGQLEDVKKQAADAQARFVAYQQQVGIVGADENHSVVMNRVDELNRQLATVEAERIVKEAQYRVAVAGNPELIATVVPQSVIQTLRRQQAELRVQYAELTAKYDDNYPKVIELRSQLKDIQTSIEQEVHNIQQRMQQEYVAARTSQHMLQAALEKQKQDALRVDASAVQYALLQRDVQASRDLYESLIKKLKDAGIDQGLRSSDLRLVDEAEVPIVPVRPRFPVNLALGLFGGIMVGIAGAFLRASFDHSIRTPNDVETECLLPALAIVPRLSIVKSRRDAPLLLPAGGTLPVTLQQPESEAAEAYRTLRTSLLSSEGPTPRVICFVSGSGREGKSTSAVNTAIVLAQQGHRVLLVDADMRCPTIHTQLQLPLESGLSECLSRGQAPSPIRIPDTTLYVLRAGERPPYISELLGSTRMQLFLHRWRYEYDFVIIDTPPVLAFTDGVIVAGLADATVLVVRSMTTNRQALWHVKQRLERAHALICGVLLNDVQYDTFDAESFLDRRAYARYEGSMTA